MLIAVNVMVLMVLLMPWVVKTISKSDCIACDSRVPRDIGQSIRHKDVIVEACNYVQARRVFLMFIMFIMMNHIGK